MKIGFLFYLMMFLWFLFWILGATWQDVGRYERYGHGVFTFILFLLLGWNCFGAPIQTGGGKTTDA